MQSNNDSVAKALDEKSNEMLSRGRQATEDGSSASRADAGSAVST